MGSPAADPAAPGPIFVVGSMGSGSTLLRLMLDSHPDIAIPGETGFLRLVLAHTQIPYWALGDQWYGNLGMSEDDLFARMREFYGGMFAEAAAARGKSRWGDKTPFHVWHLELATKLFPDCRIVGIVRHPGAVTASLRKRFRYDVPRAAQHWELTTKALVMASMELGERCAVIRYEDLLRSPEPVMRAVLDHVGEPWSPDVLTHHEIQTAGGAPVESQGFTRVDRPLDASQLNRWESVLREEDRRALADLAPLASFLGYDVDHTFPLGDLADPPRVAVTGLDLARRRTTRPSGVDWKRRPTPTLGNAPLLAGEGPPTAVPGAGEGTAATGRPGLGARRRAASLARRVLPPSMRVRIHRARRKHPSLDRLVGPK
jgi:hypothetical protein